jgi:hypothetical protein
MPLLLLAFPLTDRSCYSISISQTCLSELIHLFLTNGLKLLFLTMETYNSGALWIHFTLCIDDLFMPSLHDNETGITHLFMRSLHDNETGITQFENLKDV